MNHRLEIRPRESVSGFCFFYPPLDFLCRTSPTCGVIGASPRPHVPGTAPPERGDSHIMRLRRIPLRLPSRTPAWLRRRTESCTWGFTHYASSTHPMTHPVPDARMAAATCLNPERGAPEVRLYVKPHDKATTVAFVGERPGIKETHNIVDVARYGLSLCRASYE